MVLAQRPDVPEQSRGDVNLDGEINLADAVALQKYLLGETTITQEQWRQSDLTVDDAINGVDLVMLRRKLTIS